MSFQCKKCGYQEARVVLREVQVTIGWKKSVIKTVAPCLMCLQCGDLSTNLEIHIGDFVDLVPGRAQVATAPGADQAAPDVVVTSVVPVDTSVAPGTVEHDS